MKFTIWSAVVLFLLMTVAAAAQDQNCSDGSVKGTYGQQSAHKHRCS